MALKPARTRLRFQDIESVPAPRREPNFDRHGSPTSTIAGDRAFMEHSANQDHDSARPITTVGATLRAARETHGWTVQDVASHLRIRSNFLQALEEGQADQLPGVAYAIGYVRAYASFLGLDPEDAVGRFKEEEASVQSRTELVFPSPAPEGRVPGLAVLLMALVLAGGAYGGWYVVYERDGGLGGLVPDVPERLTALIDGDTTLATDGGTMAAARVGVTATDPSAAKEMAQPDAAGVTTPTTDASAAEPTLVIPLARETAAIENEPAPDGMAASEPSSTASALLSDPKPALEPDSVTTVVDLADQPPVVVSAPTLGGTALPASDTADQVEVQAPDTQAQAPLNAVPTDVAPASAGDAAADATFAEPTVPSAPRIAGLIGASEAAVPATPGNGPTTASVDRLVIRAIGDSWVQVRDEAGHTLYTRVMREGDAYRVPDRAGLSLATGNAGALEILVQGQVVPSLGAFGEVVRNVDLTPERLIAGTAAATQN